MKNSETKAVACECVSLILEGDGPAEILTRLQMVNIGVIASLAGDLGYDGTTRDEMISDLARGVSKQVEKLSEQARAASDMRAADRQGIKLTRTSSPAEMREAEQQMRETEQQMLAESRQVAFDRLERRVSIIETIIGKVPGG